MAGGPARLVAGGPTAGPPPVGRVAARAAAAAFIDGAPVRLAGHELHRQRPCVACKAHKP